MVDEPGVSCALFRGNADHGASTESLYLCLGCLLGSTCACGQACFESSRGSSEPSVPCRQSWQYHPEACRVKLHSQCKEDVRLCLESLTERLQAPGPGREAARDMILDWLDGDVPARLVTCLGALDFEARKSGARLFDSMLRGAAELGIADRVAGYLRGQTLIVKALVEGCGRPEISWHCGEMLRSCARDPALVEVLLEERLPFVLLDLAEHSCFEISSESLALLKDLAMSQPAVSAPWVTAHFEDFVAVLHRLLEAQEYTTQRQVLNLCGSMLLSPEYAEVMVRYVQRDEYMQIYMRLLRDRSKAIQIGAFHVFKIFVANPSKPRGVREILARNAGRLLRVLEALPRKMPDDDALACDAEAIAGMLRDMDEQRPL